MSQQIIAPLPGIFYRPPAPDKPTFVEVGDVVKAGQVLGLIEIMKQFNEVRSDVAGTLLEFHVADNGVIGPGDVIATID